MLRLIRRLPDPRPTAVRIVGVDDFALRRGLWPLPNMP
jgi:hypothetical protein